MRDLMTQFENMKRNVSLGHIANLAGVAGRSGLVSVYLVGGPGIVYKKRAP